MGYLGHLRVLTKEDSEVGLAADQPDGEGWALEELSHPGIKRRRIARGAEVQGPNILGPTTVSICSDMEYEK